MKLIIILIVLLLIYLMLGCATVKTSSMNYAEITWTPLCWHKALFHAITVASHGYEIRIVEGYRNNNRHAEAQVKLNGSWWYLDYNGFYVYTKSSTIKRFKPMEAFTLEQYLVRMKHWFKEKK